MPPTTQSAPTRISFGSLPSMVPAYARVLLSKKPYVAPPGIVIEPVELEARRVVLSAAHLRRYREVCSVADGAALPAAYLQLAAIPLRMQLFVCRYLPVMVLA